MSKTKSCSDCGIEKDIKEYYKTRDTNVNKCKSCCYLDTKEYVNTKHGFFVKLLKSSRTSSKNRLNDASQHTITISDIYAKWNEQNGLCYYSYIPMITMTNHDWECSLERKDPQLGYVKNNIVLCCQEFQHRLQWNHTKIDELILVINKKYNFEPVDFSFIRKQTIFKTSYETIDDIEYITCNKCNTKKPSTCFNKNISIGCKECIQIANKVRRIDPRSSLLCILKDARNNNKKKSSVRKYDFDIDLEYLIELYNNQLGLCAYSGIPLRFGLSYETNWTISLERLDPLKGYTKENVCLICYEFNTCDQTSKSKTSVSGSCAWSKDKIDLFMTSIFIHT
jgi:hypothetical protein